MLPVAKEFSYKQIVWCLYQKIVWDLMVFVRSIILFVLGACLNGKHYIHGDKSGISILY